MTTLSASDITIPKPPLVAVVPLLVDYTGNQALFTINFAVTSGHALSDVVSLDGSYSLSPDISASLIPAAGALQRVYCAVKIFGLSPQVSTITATLSDTDGHTATTTFDVQVHGDGRIFQLPQHTAIVSTQSELDAAAEQGGRILLRGGQYKHAGAWIANGHAAIETHPEDWFNLGIPARLEGDGGPLSSGNNQRVWVSTRDGFNLRRIEISNTRYLAFMMQDVNSPLVDECLLWNLQNQGTFKNTTNGVIRDSLVVGVWDSLTDGEHSNGLVVSDNAAGSNNLLERCLVLGVGDDCIDFWQAHGVKLRNSFLGFAGKGALGDGMGVKAGGGSSSGGSQIYLCSFFRATSFAINNNESTPDTPFLYHNNTNLECSDGLMFSDGSDNNNANALNNLDLDNISANNYGAFNGGNNSWDLSIASNANKILPAIHATWEGFDGSGFLKLPPGDSAIDAGTSTGLIAEVPIIGAAPDVGAHPHGASNYSPPAVPVGIPAVSAVQSTGAVVLEDWGGEFPDKPALPEKPDYLAVVDVPSLGTQIKRISDYALFNSEVVEFKNNDDTMLGHKYSRGQVWNSNQSLLMLHGGWRWVVLLDAITHEYFRTILQAGATRVWANTDPNSIYTVDVGDPDHRRFCRVDVRTDVKTVLLTMPVDVSIGAGEGTISNDDKKIVLTSNDGGFTRIHAIDIGTSSATIATEFTTARSFSDFDWASVSPLGNYIVVGYNQGDKRIDLYTWDGVFIRRITHLQHGDLGLDLNGHECWFTVGHMAEPDGTAVLKFRLSDNQLTVLFGAGGEFPNTSGQPVLDGHLSASSTISGSGLVHISAFFSSGGPHVVFAVRTDGSRKIAWYGFHNSNAANYYDQPHFNVSPDGQMGIFKSNWGDASGHTECYLCWRPNEAVAGNVFDVNINGGPQSFDLGNDIVHAGQHGAVANTLLGGGWVAYSAPSVKIVNGNQVVTTRLEKLAEIQAFANILANQPGANGMLLYGRWEDYEDGLGEYDTDLMLGLAGVISTLKTAGKQFGFALRFRYFYAPYAEICPVPAYIFGASYGVSWSTQATQQLATAAIWRVSVRDRILAIIDDLTSRYGDDIHLITIGETSISSVESDFNFNALNAAYRHLAAAIQAKIPHGAFLAEVNFWGNQGSDIVDLINYFISVGAIVVSLPDWLSSRASWTARKDPRWHYNVPTYDIIRDNFKGKIRFFPHWQAWDAEITDDWNDFQKSLELLADVDGFGLLAASDFTSRVQEHITGSIYYSGDYINDIVWASYNAAGFADYFYHGLIESTSYKLGGVGSGVNPLHALLSGNGQTLTISPLDSATEGLTDPFTLVLADNGAVEEDYLLRYVIGGNANADGTPTDAVYYKLKPGIDQASNNPLNNTSWELNHQGEPDRSAPGSAIARGTRVQEGTTGSMLFDLTHIPAGDYSIWARVAGKSINEDSFFARTKSDGAWSAWEIVWIDTSNYGPLFWRKLNITLSGSPELLEIAVREKNTVAELFVISAATIAPTGQSGYVPATDSNVPPVAVADSYTVAGGTTVLLDVLDNDYDPDGSAADLSLYDIAILPANGSVVFVGRLIQYTAPATAATDEIHYRIIDTNGALVVGLVTITVEAPDAVPPNLHVRDIALSHIHGHSINHTIDLNKFIHEESGLATLIDLDGLNPASHGTIDFDFPTGILVWSDLPSGDFVATVGYRAWISATSGDTQLQTATITLTAVTPEQVPQHHQPSADIALNWHGEGADASIDGADLQGDNGLRTAVILSLFADRRAGPDDIVDDQDQRGWWADVYGDRPLGSRLWLLDREKDLPEVVNKAHDYAHEALDWLQEDGIAKAIEIDITSPNSEELNINVRIIRPDDTLLSLQFQRRWQVEEQR